MNLSAMIPGPHAALIAIALFGLASLIGILLPSKRFGASGVLCMAACATLVWAAAFGPDGSPVLGSGIGIAGVEVGFRIDSLSRWFLGLIGIVGLPVCVYFPGYLGHLRGKAQPGLVWSGFSLLMASMAGVVLAKNAITFFAFWELMAFSSFLLVATEHERQSVRRAAYIYLGATRLGSAFLMAGFFWAHSLTGSWDFQNWVLSGNASSGPAALILVGLLTKAGSWPVHLWLPIAHPTAPSPVSAVMSGVMIKTAIYGLFRLFVFGGYQVGWMGWTLVILGAVSAFWGIMFSLLQGDMKRMLAYSSVENIGLILMAAGVSLVSREAGLRLVSEMALVSGLFHALNHGLFKSLLFLGAGAVDTKAHTREIERLGGLIHRMPWTSGTFLIGAAAACALPPLNGFACEWLLYGGLFRMGSSAPSGELRLAGLLLLGWLGLTGALVLTSFARVYGIAFLGQPRSGEARQAREAEKGMAAACAFLAAACVAIGLAGPWIWPRFSSMGFVKTPDFRSLSVLPLVGVGAAFLFLTWLALKGQARSRTTRRCGTWDCGFGVLGPRTQYTAASFTQPIVRLFGALYRYEMEVAVEGSRRRHFPTEVRAETHHEAYLESRVYVPALGSVMKFAERLIVRLQAGSIHQYLLFMVITLGLLLWLGGVL